MGEVKKMSPGRMKKKDLPPLPMLLLAGCLLLGAAAGCIWMVFFQKEGAGAPSLEQWAGEGRLWLFFRLLGGFLLYLLPLFCCGFFSLGAYGVLILFAARGFTLACWVGAFCRDYGLSGYAASFLLGAGGALLTTLCMLELGERAMGQALQMGPGRKGRRRRRMGRRPISKDYLPTFLLCLLLCLVYSFLGSLLAPWFCRAALAFVG